MNADLAASMGFQAPPNTSDQGSLERIRDALDFIPSDDRETWLRMGMAIKDEIGEAGHALWDAWSQKSDAYSASDARDVWRSIKVNGGIAIGTLFREAKLRGWRDEGYAPPTPEDAAERQRRQQEQAEADAAEVARQQAETARKARVVWQAATPAQTDHPYLVRKGVHPTETLRETPAEAAGALLGYHPKVGDAPLAGRLLVVPIVRDGHIATLELIDESGRKAALAGRGTKTGGYWAAGELPGADSSDLILQFGEGVATALTGHQATGYPTVATLALDNAAKVLATFRARYPRATFVFMADIQKDTGQVDPKAIRAAQAHGAIVAVPDFGPDRPEGATDFNDLYQARGVEAVRQAIAEALGWGSAKRESTQPPGESGESGKKPATGVTVLNAASIKVEPIRWLWPGWLAKGKVHLCAGAPGTGKTTVAMAIAATLTIGGRWPDGTPAETGQVMVWSGEDDPTDTLVPRLMAAGADLSKVHLVAGYTDEKGSRSFDPSQDADALGEHIAGMDEPPALLIIDPIVSAVAGDSHKNAEVRRSLQPLVDLAMVRRCAVLGITHFSKGSAGRDPVERVTGSLAFGALARVVLATARLSDEEGGGRILVRGKSNIGPDSGGFGYDLDICEVGNGIQTTRILWGDVLEGSARDLLSGAEVQADPEERSQTAEAVDWILEHLSTGPAKAKDVQREAKEAGISEKALRTARERLGIKITKSGFQGGYRWELPPKDASNDAQGSKDAPGCPVDNHGHHWEEGHHWSDTPEHKTADSEAF